MILSGAARLAGVMGWPVKHSLSPRLHGYWLVEDGIDGAYVPLAVAPERLGEALRGLPALGFQGCNVTIPHKEAAFALMDEVTPLARRLGAVNTVAVDGEGRLLGSNTDGFGFIENLRANAPDWRADAGPAVILGAGGAAAAVVAALQDAGCPEVRLLNRTRARAETLAGQLGGAVTVHDWADRAAVLAGAGLLANTTALGMTGQDPLEIDLAALPMAAVVTDIVYNPLMTGLLADARGRGNTIVDGIGMLLHQARPGFSHWYGAEPTVSLGLRDHVLAGLG